MYCILKQTYFSEYSSISLHGNRLQSFEHHVFVRETMYFEFWVRNTNQKNTNANTNNGAQHITVQTLFLAFCFLCVRKQCDSILSVAKTRTCRKWRKKKRNQLVSVVDNSKSKTDRTEYHTLNNCVCYLVIFFVYFYIVFFFFSLSVLVMVLGKWPYIEQFKLVVRSVRRFSKDSS